MLDWDTYNCLNTSSEMASNLFWNLKKSNKFEFKEIKAEFNQILTKYICWESTSGFQKFSRVSTFGESENQI